jgi:hypothetical protein
MTSERVGGRTVTRVCLSHFTVESTTRAKLHGNEAATHAQPESRLVIDAAGMVPKGFEANSKTAERRWGPRPALTDRRV